MVTREVLKEVPTLHKDVYFGFVHFLRTELFKVQGVGQLVSLFQRLISSLA